MQSETRAGALPAYKMPVIRPSSIAPITTATFTAEYIREKTRKLYNNIEQARAMSVLAEPVSQLGVTFDKVAKTDYYQAWIRSDAKVTFTLQKNKVIVYCGETTTYSADEREQERCALRSLVRSILEDPEKLTAMKAVVEILSNPDIQRFNVACELASNIALDMGVSTPDDDIYEASIKLVGYYVKHPEEIPELFQNASPRMIPSVTSFVANQAG